MRNEGPSLLEWGKNLKIRHVELKKTDSILTSKTQFQKYLVSTRESWKWIPPWNTYYRSRRSERLKKCGTNDSIL